MIFSNEEFGQVRTIIDNNEPWFVGKDVAEALGYKDTSDALKRHVNTDDKLPRCFTDSGQKRKMIVILEYPVKDGKKYDKVYSTELDYLKQKLYISEDSDDYYIELFKLAFKQYIKPLKAKKRQLAALENWDGVIS